MNGSVGIRFRQRHRFGAVAWLSLVWSSWAGAQPGNGDEDAAKVAADNYLHTLIREAPDGTSMSSTYLKVLLMPDWSREYWQYQSATFKLETKTVSVADRLNGITWKGWVELDFSAFRTLSEGYTSTPVSGSNYEVPCWDAWQSEFANAKPRWYVQKVNDQWKFVNMSRDDAYFLEGPGNSAPEVDDVARVLRFPKC